MDTQTEFSNEEEEVDEEGMNIVGEGKVESQDPRRVSIANAFNALKAVGHMTDGSCDLITTSVPTWTLSTILDLLLINSQKAVRVEKLSTTKTVAPKQWKLVFKDMCELRTSSCDSDRAPGHQWSKVNGHSDARLNPAE